MKMNSDGDCRCVIAAIATHMLKDESVRIRFDPNFWTRCPVEINAITAPTEPRLRYVPNSPFERPRFFFTSGKRGTQLIICTAKRKKIIPT
jgi:hypothetical protein